jgi:hypothetical protein
LFPNRQIWTTRSTLKYFAKAVKLDLSKKVKTIYLISLCWWT